MKYQFKYDDVLASITMFKWILWLKMWLNLNMYAEMLVIITIYLKDVVLVKCGYILQNMTYVIKCDY